jgi:hypothetical protein
MQNIYSYSSQIGSVFQAVWLHLCAYFSSAITCVWHTACWTAQIFELVALGLVIQLVGPPLWTNGQSSWLQNGDVLCFLWGTNWIYMCYVEKSRLPQSSWLQVHRSWFDSRRHHIFWRVVGLERGKLILLSTIEELLERKSRSSGLETREYGRRDPSRWPRGSLYPQRLALTSPTSGDRSVAIVCSLTQATEFTF